MLECIYFFIIGAFAGWILECAYKYAVGHLTRSPGMLNTPFCILYGVGTVILSMVIDRITTNGIILFILSMVILTFIEYITYILLKELYGLKLWDYSKMPLKLNEKVSIEFALAWGTLGTLYIKYILPVLWNFFYISKGPVLIFAIYLIFGIIFVDFVYSSVKHIKTKKGLVAN